MLDLDKHLEQWFEKIIGKGSPNETKCKFLLRFCSEDVRIKLKKECTVKSGKKKVLDNDKYLSKLLDWMIQDWEGIDAECTAESKLKLAENYSPTVSELIETSYLEGGFREHNTVELLKNFAGLSSIPINGEPVKAETNQD